jgi:hypothetical protein
MHLSRLIFHDGRDNTVYQFFSVRRQFTAKIIRRLLGAVASNGRDLLVSNSRLAMRSPAYGQPTLDVTTRANGAPFMHLEVVTQHKNESNYGRDISTGKYFARCRELSVPTCNAMAIDGGHFSARHFYHRTL